MAQLVGRRCEILTNNKPHQAYRRGKIAFFGVVQGLPGGDWVGIRLDKPLGKNDGTVNGIRVFECEPNHGVFVRQESIRLLDGTDCTAQENDQEQLNGSAAVVVPVTDHAVLKHIEKRRQQLETKRMASKYLRTSASDSAQPSGNASSTTRKSAASERFDVLTQNFWRDFTSKEIHIHHQLAKFVDQCKMPSLEDPTSTGSDPSNNKPIRLDDLVLVVVQMQQEAAQAASLFLAPYDVRQTQRIISKLQQKIEQTRSVLAPRKKFRFKAARTRLQVHRQTQPNSGITSDTGSDGNKSSDKSTDSSQFQHETNNDDNELVYLNRANEVIVIDEHSFTSISNGQSSSSDVIRRDLSFSNLRDCTICCCIETSAIRGDHLTNCRVLTGPIHGSLWLENCQRCEFFVACRQLRVHMTTDSFFHLRIASHPIIEDCHGLKFGAYTIEYDGLATQLANVHLQQDNGLWAKVNDFKWHRAQQSPNWSLIDAKHKFDNKEAHTGTTLAMPESIQQLVRVL